MKCEATDRCMHVPTKAFNPNEDVMLFQRFGEERQSFRCECGCNVFRRFDPSNRDRFRCNACGAAWIVE